MVKNSKRTAKQKKKQLGQQRQIVRVPRVRLMSRAALEYAKLLSNPCTGPLVHAPGSSEGGQVVRFESDFLLGNGATETAGALLWTPGGQNEGASNTGFVNGFAANDTALITYTNNNAAPGKVFLQNNASSYRCIAACLQVYWPGSELNRQGIIGAAQATYGLLSTASNSNASGLRSLCPVVERMPTDHLEIRWAPNFADGLFTNPASTTSVEDGHAGILLTWAGIPVSTGVRIRMVAVFEWRPKVQGLVLSSNTAHSSAEGVQEVRHMLDARDANWWNRSGQAAYNFLSGAVVAYAARKASAYPRPRVEL